MLTINGKTYVNATTKGTGSGGFYRKNRGAVVLFNPEGRPFAAAVKRGEYLVSCSEVDGKVWYMQGLSSLTARTLGVDGYSQERELAAHIIENA